MNLGIMHTKIISPDEEIYRGDTEMVVMPGEEGDFAAMYEHSPLITYLRPGKIEVHEVDNKEKTVFFVSGGFVKVDEKACIIMVDYIKGLNEINVKLNKDKIIELSKNIENENNASVKKTLLHDIDLLKSENDVALEN